MNKESYARIFMVFLCLVIVYPINATVIDTFTEEDKEFINDYLLNDKEKDAKDVKIICYISSKISDSTKPLEIKNGYKMIYSLTEQHRLNFDKVLIERLNNLIISKYLFYELGEEYSDCGLLISGLHALGITRTDTSIEYLLSLVEPVEKWSNALKKSITNNKDKDFLVPTIRTYALGGLLEPMDAKGRKLLVTIEERIIRFSDDDPHKQLLIRKTGEWEKLYFSGKDWYLHVK